MMLAAIARASAMMRLIRKPLLDRLSSADFLSTRVVSIKLITRVFAVAALTDRARFLLAYYNFYV